jgi:hypothetical protein
MGYQEFWLPFAASLLICLFAAIAVRTKLLFFMGLVGWDFSTSWATNITVFFTIINVVPLSLLHDPEKGVLTVMNFGFLLLPALAPLVYNFSRRIRVSDNKIIAQGRVFMFIIASVLTLWGALGQIELQTMLFDIYRKYGYISESLTHLFQGVLTLIGLGLLYYGYYSIVGAINIQPISREERELGETQISYLPLL